MCIHRFLAHSSSRVSLRRTFSLSGDRDKISRAASERSLEHKNDRAEKEVRGRDGRSAQGSSDSNSISPVAHTKSCDSLRTTVSSFNSGVTFTTGGPTMSHSNTNSNASTDNSGTSRKGTGWLYALSSLADDSKLQILCNDLCLACWNNDLTAYSVLTRDPDLPSFINRFNSRGESSS